jgi:hypothetical protein
MISKAEIMVNQYDFDGFLVCQPMRVTFENSAPNIMVEKSFYGAHLDGILLSIYVV